MDATQEFLAYLGKMITEEENKVRERIDRITHYAHPDDVKDMVREEWGHFYLRVEPLRQQQDYILKQLARIEAMKPMPPIIVPTDQ